MLTFYLPEPVLHATVGTSRVMNEQLLHLALMTSRPWCVVRVLPESTGPFGALGGPFRLMEYAEHNPIAYVENQSTSLFLENPPDIGPYRATLARLEEITLDGGQSRELLVRIANDYDVPEEDHDEPG